MTGPVGESAAITVLGYILLFSFLVGNLWRRLARRADELEQVVALLRQHGDGLEQFLNDSRAPADLKQTLVGISDLMSDQACAAQAAEKICREWDYTAASKLADPQSVAFAEAIDRLRSEDPELADSYEATLVRGLIAMFLRWPQTARLFRKLAPRLAADPRKEIAVAAAVADDYLLSGKFAASVRPVTA
jgi:hypothetical protein